MKKYQDAFIKRIVKTIDEWKTKKSIPNEELYRLLHSIKGTAASIGLDTLSISAEKILDDLHEDDDQIWDAADWAKFIEPITNQMNQLGVVQDVNMNDDDQEKAAVLEQQENEEKLILLVEDDVEMLGYIKTTLEAEDHTVLAAVNAEKAITIFYDQHPDCVILDINLPDQHGLHVAKMIMEYSTKYLVPILLISPEDEKEMVIQAYDLGVMDFIKKPFDKDIFIAQLNNRLRQRDHLRSAVLVDELTGAFNRKFFKMEFQRQMSELGRSANSFSIAMLDIDHFKKVNDNYGHHVGDHVLQVLAKVFLEGKRHSDYFIRYGGEEFLLFLPHTNASEAKLVIERMKEEFSGISFEAEGETFHSTFSSGIFEVDSHDIHMEDGLKRADQALYEAKEDGRDRVYIYNKETKQINEKQRFIRIGIVDDEPVVHEMLKDQLNKLQFPGFELDIESFRDGESFVESEWHEQKGKYIILLDGIMPRMDGLEVLQKMRAEKQINDFVIIMLTGRKSDKDIVKALELGADDYLTKPFSLSELEARVKRLALRMLV